MASKPKIPVIFNYQVVGYGKRDYILEFRDFTVKDDETMLKYIQYLSTHYDCQKIEITRWNKEGERV